MRGFMTDSRSTGAEWGIHPAFREKCVFSVGYPTEQALQALGCEAASGGLTPSGRFGGLLGDLALELARTRAEFFVAGLCQPIVETADMLDRA